MSHKTVRILIADDHPLFRRGLRDLIQSDAQFEIVHETSHGAETLKSVRELKPDVLILDMDMPGVHGLEVAREIQKENLPLAIVFLTMYKEEDMFNEALDVGARGFILKESAATDVLEGIRSVMAGGIYISPAISNFLTHRRNQNATLAREKPGLSRLTPAETRILKRIAENKTSKEIADELGVSVRTVENHRANICAKLDLHGIHSLVKFAFENRSRL
ncbi:MAG: response regulator transcription factor [Verrucomicrobiota bacterium]